MEVEQHRVWERIADSFDASRDRTWPHVTSFLEQLAPGTVLDLMAGNGRHVPPALQARHHVVALDWSRPLARHAERRGAWSVVGDATHLPFQDGSFDACIYVAGLHGIPSAAGRAASLRELRRVLSPGAVAQVTVWSRAAPRFANQGDPTAPLDILIPWRKDGHDEARTYHLYTPQALQADCERAGFEVLHTGDAMIVSKETPDNLVVELQA